MSETLQKALDRQNLSFFKKIGNKSEDMYKGHFSPLFSIEMRYTGRNNEKNNGLWKFYCLKNMGNQSRDMRKANVLRFSQSRWVWLGETIQKIKILPIQCFLKRFAQYTVFRLVKVEKCFLNVPTFDFLCFWKIKILPIQCFWKRFAHYNSSRLEKTAKVAFWVYRRSFPMLLQN